ncbi:amidohydrolase family protein [Massilia sp. Se16.2.3]|uniref:amidohydrolase family protein n=1 Tax=Massilia sp. Se16.2.3 TaxID=2709303 RepID=UPI001E60E2B0|nr:amidohydrolase family protein [Massilia sp. Se16.2.3]
MKFYADYRTGVDGTSRPTFTLEEMKAMVEAAHVTGRRVAAHASTDDAIRLAVLAGADTIEHGYGASEATFKLMKERGTAYIPTLTAPEAIGEYFQKHVRGGEPTPAMKGGRARLCAGAPHRRQDRQRQRCRRLYPRHQCARTGVDGAPRHEPVGGAARRDRRRRRYSRQGQGPGTNWCRARWPTSSPSRAIRRATSPRCARWAS